MLVSEWMTKEVITVHSHITMIKASRLMKEHGIHRLPVVDDEGRLQGILSEHDIKEASPSKATTLDMHELYYLLSEIKVKDIMTRDPLFVRGDDSVEQAAVLMVEKHIGGLPVVDDGQRLIGIITDSDIFKIFIDLTGATQGGLQLAFELPVESGGLREILDDLKERKARVLSVLTLHKDEGARMVYIRVREQETEAQCRLVAAMRERFHLAYWRPKF